MPRGVTTNYWVDIMRDPVEGLVLEVHTPTGGGFRVSSSQNLDTLSRELGRGFDTLVRGEKFMVMSMIKNEFTYYNRRNPGSRASDARIFAEDLYIAHIMYLTSEIEELKRKK